MENLTIEKSKYTLEVNFDSSTGNLKMSGESYPENAVEFFQPIFEWIREYVTKKGKPIVLDLDLSYLNTSSTKCVLDIFEILERFHKEGGQVQVNWRYAEDDEDILETGEEISEDVELPVKFIAY